MTFINMLWQPLGISTKSTGLSDKHLSHSLTLENYKMAFLSRYPKEMSEDLINHHCNIAVRLYLEKKDFKILVFIDKICYDAV